MLDVGGERDDKDDGDGDGDDDDLLALHGLWAMEAFAWRNPFKQHCHLGDISAHIEQYTKYIEQNNTNWTLHI